MYTFNDIGRAVVVHTFVTWLIGLFSDVGALAYVLLMLLLFLWLESPLFTIRPSGLSIISGLRNLLRP